MSTRSVICKELPNGKYRAIYCHFDGYVEHNGCILNDTYDTEEKVDKLLSLGDLSMLDIFTDKIEDRTHDQDTRQFGVCLTYNRDLKEKDLRIRYYSFDELIRYACEAWAEYIYLFRKDGKWTFSTYQTFKNNVEEADKSKMFKDLDSYIELTVSPAERYNLTPERANMLNELSFKFEDEYNKITEYSKTLEPIEVFNKASEIATVKAIKQYLSENLMKFSNQELKYLLAKKDVLEAVASEPIIARYPLTDRLSKATDNFLFSCKQRDSEQY